jgi:hypothetical protein
VSQVSDKGFWSLGGVLKSLLRFASCGVKKKFLLQVRVVVIGHW